MTDQSISSEELIQRTQSVRGYLNTGHVFLAEEDPEFLQAYNEIAARSLLHHDDGPEGGMPAKYRELLVCTLLSFRGQPTESIRGHLERALRLGATQLEAINAFEAALIPGGAPTMLNGMKALYEIRRDSEKRKASEP